MDTQDIVDNQDIVGSLVSLVFPETLHNNQVTRVIVENQDILVSRVYLDTVVIPVQMVQ